MQCHFVRGQMNTESKTIRKNTNGGLNALLLQSQSETMNSVLNNYFE